MSRQLIAEDDIAGDIGFGRDTMLLPWPTPLRPYRGQRHIGHSGGPPPGIAISPVTSNPNRL